MFSKIIVYKSNITVIIMFKIMEVYERESQETLNNFNQ